MTNKTDALACTSKQNSRTAVQISRHKRLAHNAKEGHISIDIVLLLHAPVAGRRCVATKEANGLAVVVENISGIVGRQHRLGDGAHIDQLELGRFVTGILNLQLVQQLNQEAQLHLLGFERPPLFSFQRRPEIVLDVFDRLDVLNVTGLKNIPLAFALFHHLWRAPLKFRQLCLELGYGSMQMAFSRRCRVGRLLQLSDDD